MLTDHARPQQDSPKKTVRRLKDIRPFEVAFVPAGANGWGFLVCKEDSMLLTVESVTKAQSELNKVLEQLKAGTALPAELLKSFADTLLPLLAGGTVPLDMITELKSLATDLETVTQQCADMAVLDSLDGCANRATAILKMAEAGATAKADQSSDTAAGVSSPAPVSAGARTVDAGPRVSVSTTVISLLVVTVMAMLLSCGVKR
jgi:hypothetical protein